MQREKNIDDKIITKKIILFFITKYIFYFLAYFCPQYGDKYSSMILSVTPFNLCAFKIRRCSARPINYNVWNDSLMAPCTPAAAGTPACVLVLHRYLGLAVSEYGTVNAEAVAVVELHGRAVNSGEQYRLARRPVYAQVPRRPQLRPVVEGLTYHSVAYVPISTLPLERIVDRK